MVLKVIVYEQGGNVTHFYGDISHETHTFKDVEWGQTRQEQFSNGNFREGHFYGFERGEVGERVLECAIWQGGTMFWVYAMEVPNVTVYLMSDSGNTIERLI